MTSSVPGCQNLLMLFLESSSQSTWYVAEMQSHGKILSTSYVPGTSLVLSLLILMTTHWQRIFVPVILQMRKKRLREQNLPQIQ